MISQTDESIIRKTIWSQLDALRVHDGERALSCSTPARRKHGSGDGFVAALAQAHPQLLMMSSAEFGDLRIGDTDLVAQPVTVTASDGSVLHAIYVLRRQRDGGWLIDGCVCSERSARRYMN